MQNIPSIKAPSIYFTLYEFRIFYEVPSYLLTNIFKYPEGDGHPVLVLPGFMSSDITTLPIRLFLDRLNYKTHGWNLGINFGFSDVFEEKLLKVLYGIYHYYNKKVSIIGWSLGGLFAREIAKKKPEMVRSVITLGSPFNDITTCTNLKWLYEIVGRQKVKNIDYCLLKNLDEPPPVPTTAIYSHTDGIVAGKGCMNKNCSDQIENIPVFSSHLGLCFNFLVYNILANRLSQKENDWKPYEKK